MKLEAVRAVSAPAHVRHAVVLEPGQRAADLAAFQEVLRAPMAPSAVRRSSAPGGESGRPLAALQAWSDHLEQGREAVRSSSEETVRSRDALSMLRMSKNVVDASLSTDLTAKVIGLAASRLEQLTKLS